jgi:hypothetical protein
MTRILILISLVLPLCAKLALGQQKMLICNFDSTISVTSTLSKLGYVESIQFTGVNFKKDWPDLPVPDSAPCEGIADLISTCAVLDLPLIHKVWAINDTTTMLYGNCHTGAIQVKQVVLINVFSGKILGWYAFFTGRTDGMLKYEVDLPSRTVVIGSRENDILYGRFFCVDRNAMEFTQYGANQEWLWQMVARLNYPAIALRSPRVYYGIRF